MSRSIFTLLHLTNKLDDELSWRRKELQLINGLIPPQSSPRQTAILRAAIPILYAHWEGFVKIVTESYLEFVANKYSKHSELRVQFLTMSILKKIDNYEKADFEQKVKFVETLINEFEKKSNIPIKNIIETKSNLWFQNFEEIIYLLSLEIRQFMNYEDVINDLVARRNFIAHGHFLKVDHQTYFNIHDDIIIVMTQLKTEIENAASQSLYLDTNRFSV